MRNFLLLIFFISLLNANILQETIDKAPVGATLKLPAGIYKGNIVINKPLTIVGNDKNVIIDGGGVGKVITINSSNVVLKNLTIQNSGKQMHNLDSAIFINKSHNSEVSNCKILNSLYGIDMLMVEDSLISNNFITSYDNDIGLRGDALKIWHSHNNIIRNNTIDKVRDATINYSNNNTITNNHISNSRFALHIEHSEQNIIKENEFRYNSVSLMLMMTKETKVTNNSIQSSKGAAGIGIMLKGGHNLLFENNKLKYNAKGMYIDSKWTEMGMKRYITNNEISYNKEAIHFHLTIRNNTFTHNEFVGNIDDIVKSTAGFETKLNVVKYNYWDRYTGFDTNGDNIGDTSHKMYQYADRLWHYNNKVKFFYGSPVMALLNFLAQVAPFIDPILLLEDKKPISNSIVSMDALKEYIFIKRNQQP